MFFTMTKKINEDFSDINQITKVKLNTSSNIKLGNIVRKYEDDKSFRERLFDQSLEVNFKISFGLCNPKFTKSLALFLPMFGNVTRFNNSFLQP